MSRRNHGAPELRNWSVDNLYLYIHCIPNRTIVSHNKPLTELSRMTDLTRITGIGPGLASQMIAAGIPDAEALAKAHPSDIVIVRGVGAATAPVLIARAKQITAPTPDPASQTDRDAAVARPAAKTNPGKKKRTRSAESKGKDDAKKTLLRRRKRRPRKPRKDKSQGGKEGRRNRKSGKEGGRQSREEIRESQIKGKEGSQEAEASS